MGWNYWYNWTIVLPAELNAAAVLIGYWSKDINPGVWIAVCLVVAVAINFGGTKVYGECEFCRSSSLCIATRLVGAFADLGARSPGFAIIKVVTIVGLIILGIILDAKKNADGSRIGFRYWNNPGVFVQHLDIAGSKGTLSFGGAF
jgi:yeast amino acid transporter